VTKIKQNKTSSEQIAKISNGKSPGVKSETYEPISSRELAAFTVKLWSKHHLSYNQTRYVAKEVRLALKIQIIKARKTVVKRLSREEEKHLVSQASAIKPARSFDKNSFDEQRKSVGVCFAQGRRLDIIGNKHHSCNQVYQ
jgi:hypothetical protein